MKLPSGQHRNHEFGAMTSMIDVVLFLLMFFVVTSGTGQMALLLPAPLSKTGLVEHENAVPAGNEAPKVEIWLKVQRDAQSQQTSVDMNGTVYPQIQELKPQLKALAELDTTNPIIFDIGPEVPLGDVVTLYDTCHAAGFETIQFAAEPSP